MDAPAWRIPSLRRIQQRCDRSRCPPSHVQILGYATPLGAQILMRNRAKSIPFGPADARRECVPYRQLNETRRRQIRYGALALAILLLAAGVIAFSRSNSRSPDTPQAAAPAQHAG